MSEARESRAEVPLKILKQLYIAEKEAELKSLKELNASEQANNRIANLEREILELELESFADKNLSINKKLYNTFIKLAVGDQSFPNKVSFLLKSNAVFEDFAKLTERNEIIARHLNDYFIIYPGGSTKTIKDLVNAGEPLPIEFLFGKPDKRAGVLQRLKILSQDYGKYLALIGNLKKENEDLKTAETEVLTEIKKSLVEENEKINRMITAMEKVGELHI